MIIFNYLVMCIIFGTTFLAIKVGVDASAPPFFSAGIRFCIAGLILFLWMVWRKKAKLNLLFRKELLFSGVGLTFGTFSTLYWAEQYVSSGIAAVLSATGPLMIMIMQIIILKQSTTARAAIGCMIGFAGIVMLLLPSVTFSANMWWLIGCAAILIGEIFYSAGALFSKSVINKFADSSPIALNAVQMLYGGLLLLLLSSFTEHIRIDTLFTPAAIGSLVYLIIIGSMIGHSLFYWLVAKTNPIFPATWLYISPLIAVAIGVIFYHEAVTWMMLLGVTTVLGGTIVANFDSLRKIINRTTPLHARETKQG